MQAHPMPKRIGHIRDLKTAAKNQRDRGPKGYSQAVSILREAISIALGGLEETAVAENRADIAKELCDCFGLVGGVERRWGEVSSGDERAQHLKASIRAYDEGFKFESNPQFGIVDSYNLLNRLLVRLLLSPDAIVVDNAVVFDPDIPPVILKDEFEKASAVIRQQLTGPRRGNYWALADLASIEVLLGVSPAAGAYAEFIGLSPPDFAYVSALAGLRPLAELPIPSAPSLREAVNLLEVQLTRLRS
jgi:hypothetical protein